MLGGTDLALQSFARAVLVSTVILAAVLVAFYLRTRSVVNARPQRLPTEELDLDFGAENGDEDEDDEEQEEEQERHRGEVMRI